MKNLLFSFLAFLFCLVFFPAAAQTDVPESEKVYQMVEVLPRFPGGDDAMMQYLSSNIKYPAQAQQDKIEGLVVLQFVVSKTGEIANVTILKPMAGGLSEEAVRVVKSMPTWTPGKQNGKPVNVLFTLPVRFNL